MSSTLRRNGSATVATATDRLGPMVIRWPSGQERREELAALGVARLLLVDRDASPPICPDVLEDWVRLPSDERDIDARMSALRARAASWAQSNQPELDGHGRLLRGTRWVPLSPIEEQLCGLLLASFRQVVSDTTLIAHGWPDGTGTATGLRLQMTRLRRRIDDLELEVRSVRGKGYVLQSRTTPGGAP